MTNTEFASFLNNAKWYDIEVYVSTQELTEVQQSLVFKQKDDIMLQAALAKNPHLCPAAQVGIARRRDRDYDEARENLADNKACCEAAQGWLVNDPDELVTVFLASNPNLCEKFVNVLAKSSSFEILSRLYFNHKLPEKLKRKLDKNKSFQLFLKTTEIL